MTDDSVADGLAHVLLALDAPRRHGGGSPILPTRSPPRKFARLGQVISRAQLILSFIDARRAPKIRAMQ